MTIKSITFSRQRKLQRSENKSKLWSRSKRKSHIKNRVSVPLKEILICDKARKQNVSINIYEANNFHFFPFHRTKAEFCILEKDEKGSA
jgi:hypothetical protein